MVENHSPAVEDYLKAIYQLSASGGHASNNQIAQCLDVTPASVTGMLRKLSESDPPCVIYRKHHGVILTPHGKAIALEIIRRHRLLELFLYETLGYSWEEVHQEADRLEHTISPDLVQRIATVLGNPERDPHGEPIPNQDLLLPVASKLRLSELHPGQEALVDRVDPGDENLLRHLKQAGLIPQAWLAVLASSSQDDHMALQLEGRDEPILLDRDCCSHIFVQVIESFLSSTRERL